MSETTTELKREIERSLNLLQMMRDEIRVKLHLASLDAKDEWRKLEPQIADLERKATDFSEATRKTVSEAVQRASKVLSGL